MLSHVDPCAGHTCDRCDVCTGAGGIEPRCCLAVSSSVSAPEVTASLLAGELGLSQRLLWAIQVDRTMPVDRLLPPITSTLIVHPEPPSLPSAFVASPKPSTKDLTQKEERRAERPAP